MNNPPLQYSEEQLDQINICQVHSENLLLYTQTVNANKLLVYPFWFKNGTHRMLVDTGADCTMVNEQFVQKFQLPVCKSKVRAVRLADGRSLPITWEVLQFQIKLDKINTSIARPVMTGINYDV